VRRPERRLPRGGVRRRTARRLPVHRPRRGALQSGKATSVEGIGAALRAGTNCGSCLPELKRIVANPAAEATRAADAGATVSPPTARTREPSAMS
jgi:bacterioferritin-associated ferredoxin